MQFPPILQDLFRKRGIKDANELSLEERSTFENYQRILSKRELSISDMREFCAFQVSAIETKWRDHVTTNEKKAELIPYHTVYKTLLAAIDAPESERIALEQVLRQQILN